MKAGELTARTAEIWPLQEPSTQGKAAGILRLACCLGHVWPRWQGGTEGGGFCSSSLFLRCVSSNGSLQEQVCKDPAWDNHSTSHQSLGGNSFQSLAPTWGQYKPAEKILHSQLAASWTIQYPSASFIRADRGCRAQGPREEVSSKRSPPALCPSSAGALGAGGDAGSPARVVTAVPAGLATDPAAEGCCALSCSAGELAWACGKSAQS